MCLVLWASLNLVFQGGNFFFLVISNFFHHLKTLLGIGSICLNDGKIKPCQNLNARTLMTHEALMREAIRLSLENVRSGTGGPFGAIVARKGEILAVGTNLVTSQNDPTAHAEVVAIRNACQHLRTFELKGCDLYTTCEPCPMCLGAIYWARIERVFFGNTRHDAAEIGFDDAFIYDEIPRDLSARNLPMIPLLREEALATFRAWQQSATKKPY